MQAILSFNINENWGLLSTEFPNRTITVSIPAISMGIYGCDIESATETIVKACIEKFKTLTRSFIIKLVVWKKDSNKNAIFNAYKNALNR